MLRRCSKWCVLCHWRPQIQQHAWTSHAALCLCGVYGCFWNEDELLAKDEGPAHGRLCDCLYHCGTGYLHAHKPCCWTVLLEVWYLGRIIHSCETSPNPVSATDWQLLEVLLCDNGDWCVHYSGNSQVQLYMVKLWHIFQFWICCLIGCSFRVTLLTFVDTLLWTGGVHSFAVVQADNILRSYVQVGGSIDDLLRRSGRNARGYKEGLVLIYDTRTQEWSRGQHLPYNHRKNGGAACTVVQC